MEKMNLASKSVPGTEEAPVQDSDKNKSWTQWGEEGRPTQSTAGGEETDPEENLAA